MNASVGAARAPPRGGVRAPTGVGSVGTPSSARPAQGTIDSELKRTRGIRQFNKNQAL